MARTKRQVQPKQIVYLFGAGATQAEVSFLGAKQINLLMMNHDHLGEGVSTRILNRLGPRSRSFFDPDRGFDIEKLISLMSSSGSSRLSRLADDMRRHYFTEICSSLVSAGVIDKPFLASALFELHHHASFGQRVETLAGVLTTNHDGLVQIACQNVFGAVNLGFSFKSVTLTASESALIPVILQLHGSFTWKFGLPISVEPLRSGSTYSRDACWIPPSILKESKSYPFNKLMALAYETLAKRCDVLRIVGASLTQNDWNVLSLIFTAQRHRELTQGRAFRIELIMPHDVGEKIKRDCSYLRNITPVGYLTEGLFEPYKELTTVPAESELNNVFAYWLKQKLMFHRRRSELGDGGLTARLAELLGETP